MNERFYHLYGALIYLGPLFTYNGTIPTGNAAIGKYFGLTVNDPDRLDRTFPHTGITDPAKVLNGIYQWTIL
jgi:hypothetical protein